MNRATLAWGAFRNMLRTARRDPLWAFTALLFSPVRLIVSGYKPFIVLFVITLVLFMILSGTVGDNPTLVTIGTFAIVALILALAFRMLTNPLIEHFGDMDGDTHGSARFASDQEMAALTRSESGLLIGRDLKTGRPMRYDGPAHLLTMAPTRTGKGVGTIIPNLLSAERSILCIDPKGENARIAGRARRTFGPVHVLDPFGVTGMPSSAFNPIDMLDVGGLDVAEDAGVQASNIW